MKTVNQAEFADLLKFIEDSAIEDDRINAQPASKPAATKRTENCYADLKEIFAREAIAKFVASKS